MEIYQKKEPPQRQMELRLRFFGEEHCQPLHSWGPGLRDLYIVHYVHSGKGQFSTGGETYKLTAGAGFLITPGTLVHYTADDTDPWSYSWIGFDGLHARAFLQRAGLSVSQPIFHANNGNDAENNWFEDAYRLLMDAYQRESSDIWEQSVLYRYIAELVECSEARSPEPKRANSKEVYMSQAITYIENSYSQKTTVQDIAQAVGLDSTYLSGLFKQQYGLSLQLFLLQFRMNRAVELLANPDLTVSDIARSVGYTDPFLFSKMFKKTIGIPPRAYREQLDKL
ncbi:AraC family transcriptional regulator [Paenibacillus radicis (ex Gao et al. 2016)]|uniref:AraC family transcriptional regulator n=1 Tax=Paenibacillus radicis (ex Gao et al. 2016) TaxID=1737354 RepID=A0A917MAB8_9BACL|nr:AraC family transcriptional regulator [Paenibacillus radicis (ex Gao et al. 2016)]GGG87636.1 AraC family transcriptional regulator [Paenibacillus radicis (ex Gao et al. 2016)]